MKKYRELVIDLPNGNKLIFIEQTDLISEEEFQNLARWVEAGKERGESVRLF